MKKLLLFAAIAAMPLLFTSCKKTRTCSCESTTTMTYDEDWWGEEEVEVHKSTASYSIRDTKKNAEARCEGYNSTDQYSSPGWYSSTSETKCTLE